jgi:hypothetical protein
MNKLITLPFSANYLGDLMKANGRWRRRRVWEEEYTRSVGRETFKEMPPTVCKQRRDDKPEVSVMVVLEWIILV